jgi:DNA primase
MDPGLILYVRSSPVPRHSETTLSAIKNAIDIVALVGEYLPLRRVGTRYKALCPFHDDKNPSFECNPERQTYKCWSCGARGDIFDFVMNRERVDFAEALRMLAQRAGVTLERSTATAVLPSGPSKTDLFEVNAWAEEVFIKALSGSNQVINYLKKRGLTGESAARFRLGHAPAERGWFLAQAKRKRFSMELLEEAGLVSQSADSPGLWRERFRGRLMFPIHDEQGRTLGFGGRILPEIERTMAALGRHVAKYLNSPETALFHKRTILYAAGLARNAARQAGWVAVVEGYTDVIAAHQVGQENVVGTLGTALGEDHLKSLRRLADRVVLVFDGDQAGQTAADRALELFLESELDLRVLSLPANVDPCDFLLKEGADAFRGLAERAVETSDYLLSRAAARFDLSSIDGSRRAAEWVLSILSRIPETHRLGLEFKKAKFLDSLSQRLRVPLATLSAQLRQMRRAASVRRPIKERLEVGPNGPPTPQVNGSDVPIQPSTLTSTASIRQSDLDPTDLEFIRIILNEPTAVTPLIPRIGISTLRDAPLRAVLQSCYDLQSEGETPSYEKLMIRIDDRAVRGLIVDLMSQSALGTPDGAPLPENIRPAPWQERLENMLVVLDERERQARLSDLKKAKDQTDPQADPDAYRAIELEYRRLLTSRRPRRT